MYLWRQEVRRAGGDLFLSFLEILAEKQDQEEIVLDETEVINNFIGDIFDYFP